MAMQRLHPLVLVARAVQYGISGLGIPVFALGMGSLVFGEQLFDRLPFLPLMGLGLLVGVGYGVLSYRMFTYEITEDTFDLHSGVIARREREIPHGRVQNVDVIRSFWQQLLGVAVVRIETAGGGTTEAALNFVSIEEAERLQRELRERRAAAGASSDEVDTDSMSDATETVEGVGATSEADSAASFPAEQPETSLLFRLRPRELFLYAGTEIRLGTLFLTALGTPLIDDLVIRVLLAAASPLGGPETLRLSALRPDEAIALAVVGLPLWLVGAWIVGAVLAFNNYHGFHLGRRGEDYVYERGLLSEYSGSIPSEKIQTLTVTENVLQRALGYASLSIETAGYAGSDAQQLSNRASVPLAARERTHALANAIEDVDLDVTFTRPPRIARRRYAIRFSIVVLALLGLSYVASRTLQDFTLWWLPALLLPLVPVGAHLRWVNRGFVPAEDHLLVRSGFWRRRTRVVPYDRLQTAVRTRSVFQRRLDLAHLVADTASAGALRRGGATIYDVSVETSEDVRNTLRERLQAHLRERRSKR